MFIIPSFLPDNQKKCLEILISDAGGNKFIAPIKIILDLINAVHKKYSIGHEILKGAHIIIKNTPSVYDEITDKCNLKLRSSSHYPGTKIEERGIELKESQHDFLIGKNNDGPTWLQLERHEIDFSEDIMRGISLLTLHISDYLWLKLSGKNVGPCGCSEYIEGHPIELSSSDLINI